MWNFKRRLEIQQRRVGAQNKIHLVHLSVKAYVRRIPDGLLRIKQHESKIRSVVAENISKPFQLKQGLL